MDKEIPQDLIQVNVTMSEVRARIDQFLQHKRAQADVSNVLDFCGRTELTHNCARIDAVLVRKKDSSSHLAVRHVLDRYTCKTNSENLTMIKGASKPQLVPKTSQQNEQVAQKGMKRTYDIDSLEVMLDQVKK